MLFFQRDKRKEKKLYNFMFLKYFLNAIFGFQKILRKDKKKLRKIIFSYLVILR